MTEMNSRLSKEELLEEERSTLMTIFIALGFVGGGLWLLSMFASDPQAQFALSLFKEAEQLTQLSRSRAARNGGER